MKLNRPQLTTRIVYKKGLDRDGVWVFIFAWATTRDCPYKINIPPMGQPQRIAPTKFGGKLTTRIVYKKGLDREGVREMRI